MTAAIPHAAAGAHHDADADAQLDEEDAEVLSVLGVVRVERVNVESGGQAIVGDVSTGGRAKHEK